MTLHLLVTGVYVFDVLLNENLILSIHALLCSLLIYLRNFWSIVNFVSRLLHGFNWIARQSAIQNYAVTIKIEVDFDQVDVLLSILTSDSDHSSRIVPLMKKFKEWITPPNRVHSFFISSPSTPFWEFINSLSIRYIITVIILPHGHVCSVSRRLVSLQNSYIVIASAKTSGSIYLKVLISVRIVTKTTIGANFLGMKRTQKCEGKLLLCV